MSLAGETCPDSSLQGTGVTPAATQTHPKKLHIDHLDGIRGLAALYIVCHHTHVYAVRSEAGIPEALRFVWSVFKWGPYPIVVFIVLSGYCLTIPIARSQDIWFRGGVGEYLRRRAWRILPPYYASLVFALSLASLVPSREQLLAVNPKIHWISTLPAWDAGVLISHLLLIHNFSPQCFGKINGPAWTIATEWQLYFTLPCIILGWKRLGPIPMIVLAVTVSYLCGRHFRPLYQAAPWLFASFTFGVVAAFSNFRPGAEAKNTPKARLCAFLAFCGTYLLFVTLLHAGVPRLSSIFVQSMVFGAATAFGLHLLTAAAQSGAADFVTRHTLFAVRCLSSRPAVWLGAFSYSLYLIHGPILNMLQYYTLTNHVPMLSFLGPPLSVAAALVFYHFVEKPSLRAREGGRFKRTT